MFKKKYEGFTLVEMLIVMGIIVILMALGIASGRFAINRANKIQHQGSVDNLYQALQAYYTDNREYPDTTETGIPTWSTALGAGGALEDYIEAGSFDGGSDATYYYIPTTESDLQSMLVCVSLGGPGDEKEYGYYCNGNGFGVGEVCGGTITDKEVGAGAAGRVDELAACTGVIMGEWAADTGW